MHKIEIILLFLIILIPKMSFAKKTFDQELNTRVMKTLSECLVIKNNHTDRILDQTSDYSLLTDSNLQFVAIMNDDKILTHKLYFNNSKKKITKTKIFTYFLPLLNFNRDKIYFSNLILEKKTPFYYFGFIKNSKSYILFFSLELPDNFNYILMDSQLTIFYNTTNFDIIEIKQKIQSRDSKITQKNVTKFHLLNIDLEYFLIRE